MPIVSSCPNAATFERLRSGQLSAADVEQLARHLEQCGRCAAAVEALKPDDTLTDALRAKSTAIDRPEGDVVAKLVSRLKQIRPLASAPIEATAAFTNAAPLGAPVGEGTQAVYDFLAPSRGPGEIGWLGPYRVLKVLGVGGMGVVFQAEDPHLKRLVALKAMKPALAADAAARDASSARRKRPPPSKTITSSPSTRLARTAACPIWRWISSKASHSTPG